MHRRSLLARFGILAALVGCPTPDDTTDTTDTNDSGVIALEPIVRITGGAFVEVGETLALTASTIDGADAGYAWSSDDEAIATVDESGVVTGRSRGEARITATGLSTEATGTMAVAVEVQVPYVAAWRSSGHADVTSEAFRHWDEDGMVPTSCARCHTSTGYRDYLGDDGTTVDAVDTPHPPAAGVTCEACHNDAALALEHVTFPSGVTLTGLGAEARCMTCHQGLASGDDITAAIAAAGNPGDDTVDTSLGFLNIHYYAAGATLNAGRVRGGYQYGGELYDRRFRHVPGLDTCVGCHDPHTLELRVETCADCHPNVSTRADLRDVRMVSSATADYDGDGDLREGMYHEVDGLQRKLYTAMQRYAAQHGPTDAICYDSHAYPYFFVDADHSGGMCSEDETTFPNRYTTWTPRLLKASYNYQVAAKDPGAYAHNAKYIIELLHDAIVDLNETLEVPVEMSRADRTDSGHFNGASPAFRRWDPTGTNSEAVTASCTRCHGGAEGFAFHTTFGADIALLESPNGLDCSTCHPSDWNYDPNDPKLVSVAQVILPGGATRPASFFAGTSDAICATCHVGRESKRTIDDYLAQTNNNPTAFRNVHYLPAAATLYGTEVQGGYEYDGKSYDGRWNHPTGTTCTTCHVPGTTKHTFKVEDAFATCTFCHASAREVSEIRFDPFDFNGNGLTNEPLPVELSAFQGAVLDAMSSAGGACYDEHAYPYWFKDTNGSGGHCDPGEATSSNRFSAWTPALLKASHNVQLSKKDPGAWAHNMRYIAQLLYDSAEDLGASPPTWNGHTLNRPPAD